MLHEGFYKLAATVTRSGVCQKMGVGPFGKDQGRLAGCEVCNPNLEKSWGSFESASLVASLF